MEFRSSERDLGIPNRISEFGNVPGNSQTAFGIRKGIWEFPNGFRSSETDLGVPNRISELRNGFGSSRWNFGVQKGIWEFPTELRSSETDLGTPMGSFLLDIFVGNGSFNAQNEWIQVAGFRQVERFGLTNCYSSATSARKCESVATGLLQRIAGT